MRIQSAVWLLIASMAHSAFAQEPATPQAIQERIQKAQAVVHELNTQKGQSEWTVYAAVSFSMPKASLTQLAFDARDAGIALAFQGAGTEPEVKVGDTAPHTALTRYGKGLLSKNLQAFQSLTELGATVTLHPKLFLDAEIDDVPQIILTARLETTSGCAPTQKLFRARGDVTLRYALEHLIETVTHDTHLQPKEKAAALAVLNDRLARLGDRP